MRTKGFFGYLAKLGIVAALAIAITFALMKVSVVVGNDLVVKLSPSDKSFSIRYPEKANATFTITSINAALCTALCNYSFEDLSGGKAVEEGRFELKGEKVVQKSYLLGGKLGSGQNIYNFRVECRNEKKLLCLSEGLYSSRIALVTLNYEPNEYEKELKKKLKENLTVFLGELAKLDIELQKINLQLYSASAAINTIKLSEKSNIINSDFDMLHLNAENLRAIWHSENYTKLAEIFNENYWNDLSDLNKRASDFRKGLNSAVERHNDIAARAGNLYSSQQEYYEAEKIFSITGDKDAGNKTEDFLLELNSTLKSISQKEYSDYDELEQKMSYLEGEASHIINSSLYDAAPVYTGGKYNILAEYDFLCHSKGICKEHGELADLEKEFENLTAKKAAALIENACNELNEIPKLHEKAEIKNSEYENNTEFGILLNFTIKDLKTSITSNYAGEKRGILNKSQNDIFVFSMKGIPDNVSRAGNPVKNLTLLNLTAKEALKGMKPELSGSAINFNLSVCKKIAEFGKNERNIYNASLLQKAELPETEINKSQISANISDNPPTCCIFGKCRECCSYPECSSKELYPVIFLHGHSIDRKNSPEYSLDTFNKLQRRLQEEGYINAGIVSLYTNLSEFRQGEWSRAGAPVTVKASYYYDIYYNESSYILYPEKSESIEAYAIRLKELIGVIKYRTGQEKVIIIAHSMGGLVARRYLQILGEEDVDKLIMVATPNYGINEGLLSACAVFGGGKECGDMAENSAFIKKLNDPVKNPKKTKIYTITGTGCSMLNETGDGLVTNTSSALPFAKNYAIEGNCTGFSILHAEILDTEKYPQTYEYIKGIIRE